jgi:hypothetical protein
LREPSILTGKAFALCHRNNLELDAISMRMKDNASLAIAQTLHVLECDLNAIHAHLEHECRAHLVPKVTRFLRDWMIGV